MPQPLQIGQRVKLRRPHACGGDEWQIFRVGADVGLRCLTCGRRLLLPRGQLERRIVAISPPDLPDA
ncbi:MAG: DUF951 domain-containing protein [Bacillota bacterium]|nr:DUF951 domain-containing protein [Bacillota bacterium]